MILGKQTPQPGLEHSESPYAFSYVEPDATALSVRALRQALLCISPNKYGAFTHISAVERESRERAERSARTTPFLHRATKRGATKYAAPPIEINQNHAQSTRFIRLRYYIFSPRPARFGQPRMAEDLQCNSVGIIILLFLSERRKSKRYYDFITDGTFHRNSERERER